MRRFSSGTVGYDAATGISNYNTLNLRLEKRHSSGVDFLLNYSRWMATSIQRHSPSLSKCVPPMGFGKLTSSSATGRQLQFGLKLSF
jgi:hypothetical protein